MAQRIVLSDDLETAAGEAKPAEADITTAIGRDGEWRVLDLTNANDKQLAEDIRRYWEAARPATDQQVRALAREKQTTSLSEGRKWWDGFRRWADENGRDYTTESGKFYPARSDLREYVAFAKGTGLSVPSRYDDGGS
jgi:hypothetical protein